LKENGNIYRMYFRVGLGRCFISMEVRIAKKAGFCFGVKRAIDMARATAKNGGRNIYSLGPLIHNPQVVQELTSWGIKVIKNIDEAPEGKLIIRSHGVQPFIFEEAQKKGLEVVDATCPFVKKAQQLAHELTEEGYQVVVVGNRDHPEVHGIVGWTGGKALVVENPAEAEKLKKYPKLGVVAQTTQPEKNFLDVVEVLKKKGDEVRVKNTICHATAERQQAAHNLAKMADVMIVVGGKNSANTRKLTEFCLATGTPTYQVETAEQVSLENVRVAGVTAGASTPEWIIEEVRKRMNEFEEMNGPEEEMKEAVKVEHLRRGDIVSGVVVHVAQDEVMVDVGAKSEGVIPIKELSAYQVDSPQEVVQPGDEIEVYVMRAEDSEGRPVLSKARADAEKAWVELESAFKSGEPVEGVVREVVKGGLLVDVGVRAFMPASLVEVGYVEDLSQYLNKKVKVKVIELNRSRRKVILSRKAVLEEESARLKEELLSTLEEGQIIKGTVRRITDFGAFVDIGGLDGLLHVSEMAWYRVGHPSEVVQVGDEIEVMVIKVDKERERVSLGLKQVLPDPWDKVEEKYPVGSIVTAKVVRLAPFGAFVELEPGIEGLVHISHLSDRHVEKPEDVVSEDEEIKVKVLSVKKEEKRMRLSIREVGMEKRTQKMRDYQAPKQDGGDVTLGDMFGDLLESQKRVAQQQQKRKQDEESSVAGKEPAEDGVGEQRNDPKVDAGMKPEVKSKGEAGEQAGAETGKKCEDAAEEDKECKAAVDKEMKEEGGAEAGTETEEAELDKEAGKEEEDNAGK